MAHPDDIYRQFSQQGLGQVEEEGPQAPFWGKLRRELDAWIKTASISVVPPAHQAPPYWSQPVDLSATVTMAGPAQAPQVWTTAISYTAPRGWFARISGYGVNVRDATYTWNGSLLWRIIVNGNPVPNLINWGQQRGSIVSPRETFFLVRPEQTVLFQVRRDALWAGGSQIVEHCLVGYQYSPREEVDGSRSSVVV